MKTRQKSPDELVNQRGGRGRVLTEATDGAKPPQVRVPTMPKRLDGTPLTKRAQATWRRLWRSRLARTWRAETDDEVLEYVLFLDERERLRLAIAAEGETSTGSMGQTILNARYQRLAFVERQLLAGRDRLGLSPQARFRQGIDAVALANAENRALRRDARERERKPRVVSFAAAGGEVSDAGETP